MQAEVYPVLSMHPQVSGVFFPQPLEPSPYALNILAQRLQATDAKWETQTADLASLPALLGSCHPRYTRAHLLDSALAVLSLTQSPRSQVARAALSTLEVSCPTCDDTACRARAPSGMPSVLPLGLT